MLFVGLFALDLRTAETSASKETNASSEPAQITPEERMSDKISALIMSGDSTEIVLFRDFASLAQKGAQLKENGIKVGFEQDEQSTQAAQNMLDKSFVDFVIINAGENTQMAAAALAQHEKTGIAVVFKLDFGGDTRKFRKLTDIYRGAVANRAARAFMLGNGNISSMDESVPASISSHAIGGLLRAKMHFGGLIISADLSKISAYSTEQKVSAFLGSGGDIMYFSDKNEAKRAKEYLLKSTQNGTISNARIQKSVDRLNEILSK